MKSIIVPTDFSEASVNAAYYAAGFAQHAAASLVLLHVLPLPVIVPEMPLPSDTYETSMREARQSLSELQGKLEAYSNGKLKITYRATTGSFLEEIQCFNRQDEVLAMIMGTSGVGATQALFMGSFSLTAARHLQRPLIVVPPGYKYNGIHKAGLACDMQNVADTVPFSGIEELLSHFDAELEVLYVTRPNEKMYPGVLSETKFIQNSLAGLNPQIRITTSDDTREGLENFVRNSGIDLLLLLPKERNFVERIFHKSLTKEIVLRPEVPVMILH